MKIGVVGGGVTGSATAAAWRGHCDEVRVYDTDPARRTCDDAFTALKCDAVFVCLPETAVDGFFGAVTVGGHDDRKTRNYVLRSTVPVGTTRRLAERYGLPNLVHSPEFLTERTAAEDAANPRLNVVGVPAVQWRCKDVAPVTSLEELYGIRWPGVPVRVMTSDASELVKLATNSFFATKVAFWNEIESYCRAAGVDYETVRAACVAEGRVGDLHTRVPGPDGERGFGGKCLPKDLVQLIGCLHESDAETIILRAVHRRNELDRKGAT